MRLNADAGPFSTRDYRIALDAVPLESGRTFVHFPYSFSYGLAGRLALQAYLATIGRSKVGADTAMYQAKMGGCNLIRVDDSTA